MRLGWRWIRSFARRPRAWCSRLSGERKALGAMVTGMAAVAWVSSSSYARAEDQRFTEEDLMDQFHEHACKDVESKMRLSELIKSLEPNDYKDTRDLDESEMQKVKEALSKFFPYVKGKGDPLLTLDDYLMVLALLSVSPFDYEIVCKIVDKSGEGCIELNEYTKMIACLLPNMGIHHPVALPSYVPMFGEDGHTSLTYEQLKSNWLEFRQVLREALFNRLDVNREGYISGGAFARYQLSYGPSDRLLKFENRISQEKNKEVSEKRVSKAEFLKYEQMLDAHENIERAVSLFNVANKPFGKHEFNHLIHGVIGIDFSPDMLDVLFTTYDNDGDGQLSGVELQHALQSTAMHGVTAHNQQGWLETTFGCMKDCFDSEIGYRFRS